MRFPTMAKYLILLLLPACAFGQFRKYSNEFLNIGAGARGLSMGGAQVASVKDGTAGYWNPAALVNVQDYPSINLMHADYFGGIAKYDYGSVAIPIHDNKRTLGLSVLRFAVDDIPNTLYLIESDGSINYANVSSFNAADYAFILSFAQNMKDLGGKKFSFGANAKIIHRNVGKFATAWGFGLDAGTQLSGDKFTIGIMARDLTTTFNAWTFNFTEDEKRIFYETQNVIPGKSYELTAPQLILGGSYNFRISEKFHLMAEANLNLTFDGKRNTVISSDPISIDPRLGIEGNISDVFFVRAGVSNLQKVFEDSDTTNTQKRWIYQPSLGAGFKPKNSSISIDYAFSNLANQSNPLYSHIFSLRFDLIKKNKD
jgi:hypothetical protein